MLEFVRGREGRIRGVRWGPEEPPESPLDDRDFEILAETVEVLRNSHHASLASDLERLVNRLDEGISRHDRPLRRRG